MLSISNNVEDKTNGKIRVSTICLRNDAETNTSMALVAFSIIILSVYLLRHILKININHKKLPITLSMRKKYQFYVWRFVTVINFNHCCLILYIFWWEDIIAAKCWKFHIFSPEFWTTSIIFFRWKCKSFV